jgi:trk/ktr system potassium uptake protein
MIDRHSLFFVHGVILAGLGLAMLLPALAGALAGTGETPAFLAAAAVTVSAGGLLIAAGSGRGLRFNRKTGFLLTVTAWLSVSVFAALPFYFHRGPDGLGFLDCLFEAVSGITTTGSTVYKGLDGLPAGLLLWRGLLNWLGGAGTIAAAYLLMPFLQVGGMQLHRTAMVTGTPSPRGARRMAVTILTAYGVLSVLCLVVFWLQGMTGFDALVYAMATVSTGGFTSHDSSFGFFSNPGLQWSAGLFMIASSAPILLYVRMGQGEFLALFRDRQLRVFLLLILAATALIVLVLTSEGYISVANALRPAFVTVASYASSTGFTTVDWMPLGPFVQALIFGLILIGGCTGSPAGGLKIMRLELLMQLVIRQIHRLLSPRAAVPLRYEGQPVSSEVVGSAAVFTLAYLGTVFALAFGLALTGLDMTTSLSGAAAALGNVANGIGPVIGPNGFYGGLPDATKLLLAAGMLLGRLEIFTVLVLFSAHYWRS